MHRGSSREGVARHLFREQCTSEICLHVLLCIYMFLHVHVLVHTLTCIYIYIYTYICMYTYTYTYVYICMYMYMYMYVYRYTGAAAGRVLLRQLFRQQRPWRNQKKKKTANISPSDIRCLHVLLYICFTFMYMYLYTHTYIHIHVYIFICMYTFVHVYVHTYICTYRRSSRKGVARFREQRASEIDCLRVLVCIYIIYMYMYLYTHIYTYTYIYIHVSIYVNTHLYVCIYIDVHVYTGAVAGKELLGSCFVSSVPQEMTAYMYSCTNILYTCICTCTHI